MNFPSKASPLQTSIASMQKALTNAGYDTTFSTQKHPLEHCFSHNLASTEAPSLIYTNGKGTLSEASIASALGEYIERLQSNTFFIDFYLPSRAYYPDEVAFDLDGGYLSPELLEIYDPHQELALEDLVDFNSDKDDAIVCLPFTKLSESTQAYFPINILTNLYVSNGLATGNTPKEAQVQALSEIIERYTKIEIIKNNYALPPFAEADLKKYKKVYEDLCTLRSHGYIIEVLDASLGGKFPVTAISLINPKNATLFVSFGAHPILEVSLERTMTELMQGRNLDNLDTFEVPTFDMSIVADSFNIESHFVDSNGIMGLGFLSAQKSFEFTSYTYTGSSIDDEYEYLVNILHAMNKNIYIREYDYLGFYTCQMIVPGFSEVYPINDLIYNNKNRGKEIRDMVLNPHKYDTEDILTMVENLEDSLDMQKYIGVVFAHNFTLCDFKIDTYLKLEMYEEALELLPYSKQPHAILLGELILMQEINESLEDFKLAFASLFGQEMLEKTLLILDNKKSFVDITLHQEYKNILNMYDRLAEHKKKIMQ
ncbi:MAG: YcaO-like family protein [Sulfurimonadaceae bacterium]|jgi:ribosomal protein S12 methylthiotransferase accessory factor|nr:YcaO-like family protein [Sulfurimonadaceae bacterium]